MESFNRTETVLTRAERVVTELPLLYRSPGEIGWHRAKTENISRSGVLFKGDEVLPVNGPVEMVLEALSLTPMELASVANVLWRGNVVRTVESLAINSSQEMAATISEFTLLSHQTDFDV
jgi:hypothetical protein